MTQKQAARALNEWMQRYIDDPMAFQAQFQTVTEYLREKNDGKEPSYGEWGAEYMVRLLNEAKAGVNAA
jgi:hypothetical protein